MSREIVTFSHAMSSVQRRRALGIDGPLVFLKVEDGSQCVLRHSFSFLVLLKSRCDKTLPHLVQVRIFKSIYSGLV
jgi:hypothetical protein